MVDDYEERVLQHSRVVGHMNSEWLRQYVGDLCRLKPDKIPAQRIDGHEVPSWQESHWHLTASGRGRVSSLEGCGLS